MSLSVSPRATITHTLFGMSLHPHTKLFDRVLSSADGGLPGIPGSGAGGPTGIPGSPPPSSTPPDLNKRPASNPGSLWGSTPAPSTQPATDGGWGGPPVFQQPTPPAPAGIPQGGTFELSGWWRRVGATIIDWIIISALGIPLTILAFALFGLSLSDENIDAADGVFLGAVAAVFVVYLIVVLIYAPLTMSKLNGATLGKRAAGIRVVRADGLPITFGFAALREIVFKGIVVGIASQITVGLAWLLDSLWPLWDSEHRAIHDMMAKTRVVRS